MKTFQERGSTLGSTSPLTEPSTFKITAHLNEMGLALQKISGLEPDSASYEFGLYFTINNFNMFLTAITSN